MRTVEDVYAKLRSGHFQSLSIESWPLWAVSMAKMAKPEDKGIGDIVARVIGPENSKAFKLYYKTIFNKDCGCSGRHIEWNLKYPLKNGKPLLVKF